MNSIHDEDPPEPNRGPRFNSAIVPGTVLSSAIVPELRPAKVFQESVVHKATVPNVAAPAEVDVSQFLHSLRRNWLLGAVLGILLAVPLAAGIWLNSKPEFTVVEYVRISPTNTPLVFETAESLGRADFKSFKYTQRQLLTQPTTLSAALNDTNVASLPFVQQQGDPIGWLQKELIVAFPDEAEIMSVSLTCKDPVVAHRVVKAVVDTYMKDFVEKERTGRKNRIEDLERILESADSKIRTKRSALSDLVDFLGTGDSTTLNFAQQSSLQQLGLLRAELSKIGFELMRTKGELQARTGSEPLDRGGSQVTPLKTEKEFRGLQGAKSVPDSVSDTPRKAIDGADDSRKSDVLDSTVSDIISTRLQESLEKDLTALRHSKAVEKWEALIEEAARRFKKDTAASYIAKYQVQLDDAKQKLAERTKQLRQQLESPVSSSGLNLTENLPLKIAVLEKQEEQLREEMQNLQLESKKFGRSSIEVEMMRKEITDLESVTSRVKQEIERHNIELQSNSRRITRYPSPEIPKFGANKKRLPFTAAAGFVGLFGPLAILMLRDFLQKRVNGVDTINNRMNISVLGAIPRLPSNVIRRLNDQTHKGASRWHQRASDSMAGVTAMLLRKLQTDGHRVIMVSSAVPGEGKTTLAELLALSLAESGRRTLLIDFDLRRPQLHRRFNFPLEPGVSNMLLQCADLKRTVRHTDTPNLSVLTAGNCQCNLLQEAASGTLASLFKECRADYELVIVDSSPLLPVVDGRLVGQFTDGAILTIVKDASRIPQILSARKILKDYGITVFGCVVSGESSDGYYNSYGESLA